MKCINCEDAYEDPIYAHGHNWVAASCTQAEHCTNCGETHGQPLGHDNSLWDSEYATCTSDEYEYYFCHRCLEETIITIPATGHSHSIASSTEATCTQGALIMQTLSVVKQL